jgi:hypothetical protein
MAKWQSPYSTRTPFPLVLGWEYYGWSWTALPVQQVPLLDCPRDDPRFNCSPLTGFFNFHARGAKVGGVTACPNEFFPETTSLYAVTPQFNRTDCVHLAGLGTRPYSGTNPPVWAY